MKREFRLNRSTDFKRVRRVGKSYAHPLVVLIAAPNQDNHVRIGVAAGKSIGGAVKRNRTKRLIRAAVEPLIPQITPGWDLILLARAPLLNADCHQTQAAITELARRANLISQCYVG